jgi:hypothetical protein
LGTAVVRVVEEVTDDGNKNNDVGKKGGVKEGKQPVVWC